MFKKIIVPTLAILVVAVVMLFIAYSKGWLSKPGSLNSKQDTSDLKEYKGDYLTFKYPKKFTLAKVATIDGRVLENLKLTEEGDNSTVITINLLASDKDLTVFEPVTERRADRNQYLEEVGRMRELRGVLFRTVDKKERTVYFSNKRRVLTVDYIAKTLDLEKETEYQNLLDGMIWE
jgi:hypothetical protein